MLSSLSAEKDVVYFEDVSNDSAASGYMHSILTCLLSSLEPLIRSEYVADLGRTLGNQWHEKTQRSF
jgi:hypothetical protein